MSLEAVQEISSVLRCLPLVRFYLFPNKTKKLRNPTPEQTSFSVGSKDCVGCTDVYLRYSQGLLVLHLGNPAGLCLPPPTLRLPAFHGADLEPHHTSILKAQG